MIYDALVELPIYDEGDSQTSWLVEQVRGVAWPRMHIRIEADDRRDLRRKVEELDNELKARGLKGLEVDDFSRGMPGTLFDS